MNKKFAIAALSLGLLSAMPAANAAPVTIDAGTFEFTYRDEYTAGLSLTYANGVFTLSGAGLVANANGNNPEDVAFLAVDSYNGKPFPIILTPKAGYQIAGVTESVLGTYSASVGDGEGSAYVAAGLVSNWLYVPDTNVLMQNDPSTVAAMLVSQGSAQGDFVATGSLDFQSLNLAPGAFALSSLQALVGAGATGSGQANGNLNVYRLGVQVTAVPEPEALGLLLAGLGVVGLTMLRRRRV